MRRNLIIISVISCFVVVLTVFATGADVISAKIVDYKVNFSGRDLNDNLQNPILLHDGRTYVSIRDVAMMISRDVSWGAEREEIVFTKPNDENYLIKNENTALAIGKAIADEHYSNRINENTKYMSTIAIGGVQATDFYRVCIMFNSPTDREMDFLEILNNADVWVEIGALTGSIAIRERQSDGSSKWVSGRPGVLEID